jgi:hypothetical protein
MGAGTRGSNVNVKPPKLVTSDLKMIGSFQEISRRYNAEDPLEEAWAQLGRLATNEYLAGVKPRRAVENLEKHLAYAKVRVSQSLEFRSAGHAGTLLTAPLTLYYSFLNILRAYLALYPGEMTGGHGLHFKQADNILDCYATLSPGTFTAYLDQKLLKWDNKPTITLRTALGCIVELWQDLASAGTPMQGHVQLVHVDAGAWGETTLRFPSYPGDLAANWASDFPQFASICKPDGAGTGLIVDPEATGTTYESVSHFVRHFLLPHLTISEARLWWLYRKSELGVHWDRLAYYHVAMFILGSAVRYEPELVLAANAPDSGVGWLLRRFVSKAERYFPQLLLCEIHRGQVYM